MNEGNVFHTHIEDAREAGQTLGQQVREAMQGESPDALIVFASAAYDHAALLQALQASCGPNVMMGCSSAGEFTSAVQSERSVSAIALRSDEMKFSVGIGRHLRADREAAARALLSSFKGLDSHTYLYRYALVLTDALAGYADDLIEQIMLMTAGTYQLFGGGAGDDAKFERTHVFYGTEVVPDAAVALEILSNKPLGIGVRHPWAPASAPMRVTASDGMRLISLNAAPALEVLQEHAERTAQKFDPANPLPFFLHNTIGIDTGHGHKLRVPLSINDDGSLICAGDIPVGSTVYIMNANHPSALAGVSSAMQDALQQLDGNEPKLALFFDCVATRLRMGSDFGYELQEVQKALGSASYAGCNTYGQIVRADGQFSGFHNCTAVVCILPA